jgi:hypothetical protein
MFASGEAREYLEATKFSIIDPIFGSDYAERFQLVPSPSLDAFEW